MTTVWRFLYSYFVIPLLWILLQAAGIFNDKVRRGIRGRRGLFENVGRFVAQLAPGQRIWFHASSMGEFEQAKPLIAELKKNNPALRIIVTFFSPSGLEHSQNYPLADLVCYLPFDSARGARRFVEILRPDVAVLVRYDIWPNHIWELRHHGVPVILASATLRRQTLRRLPFVRSFHRTLYEAVTEILTVSETDAEVFRSFRSAARIECIGDTRYDQVVARSREALGRPPLPDSVVKNRKILVAGSCWAEDDAVLVPAVERVLRETPDLLVVHVPHEPTAAHLADLEQKLAGRLTSVRYSMLERFSKEQVVVVDRVGLLLSLYGCAHVAYVGGSFRQGVHNVLEAAVFGIPVLFGPRHWNSQEPLMLLERGGGFVVQTEEEFARTLGNLLRNETVRKDSGNKAVDFVQRHGGATSQVVSRIALHMNGVNAQQEGR
jgi:3-deoxy-D-manno-octulosonic-acid transferase